MPGKSSENCGKCDVPKSCASCSPDIFSMERLDLWHSALKALDGADWGDYEPDPQDVLALALFLSGEVP